jgi:rhodanese-related sulfurtransferase
MEPTSQKVISNLFAVRRNAGGDAPSLDARAAGVSSEIVPTALSAARLEEMLSDGDELAVIDVREAASYQHGHLLSSASVPLSRIDARAPLLLPSRKVRVVLVDDDDGSARRAASLLALQGYSQLHVLAGGVHAWRAAGHELFSGGSVVALAFAAFVERHCATPSIEFDQYREMRRQGRDVLLVDASHILASAPSGLAGSVACPAAELLLRVPALLRSPSTVVVITSVHEALSILGAQSLRDAGLPNPVFSLKGDPRRCALEHQVDMGAVRPAPEPGGGNLLRARRLAHNLAERYGVTIVDGKRPVIPKTDPDGTDYLIDVRQPHQFASGHRRGSINLPGDLLVNQLEQHLPVRQARVLLVDHHEVQAIVTAHWLRQMGIADVGVLRGGLEGRLEAWRGGGTRRHEAAGIDQPGDAVAPTAAREGATSRASDGAADVGQAGAPGDSAAAALRLLARVEREPFLRFQIGAPSAPADAGTDSRPTVIGPGARRGSSPRP